MQTRLNNRILFFDGDSAWEEECVVEQILTHGAEKVFSIEKLSGVQQKTKCNSLPETRWNIPSEYLKRDIKSELIQKAKSISPEAIKRVELELEEYEKRDMIPLLQVLLYLKDKMIENKVIWGVGRGSSVASYVLFLMGIHLVDSLKYGLSIKEFLR